MQEDYPPPPADLTVVSTHVMDQDIEDMESTTIFLLPHPDFPDSESSFTPAISAALVVDAGNNNNITTRQNQSLSWNKSSKISKSSPPSSFNMNDRSKNHHHLVPSSSRSGSSIGSKSFSNNSSSSSLSSNVNRMNGSMGSSGVIREWNQHNSNNHNNASHNNHKNEAQVHQYNPNVSSYSKLKYVSEGNRSWLYLTPRTKADFGSVLCWASNSIGRQKKACTFTIYPAGKFSFFIFFH